jgi:hypothetical protein
MHQLAAQHHPASAAAAAAVEAWEPAPAAAAENCRRLRQHGLLPLLHLLHLRQRLLLLLTASGRLSPALRVCLLRCLSALSPPDLASRC